MEKNANQQQQEQKTKVEHPTRSKPYYMEDVVKETNVNPGNSDDEKHPATPPIEEKMPPDPATRPDVPRKLNH